MNTKDLTQYSDKELSLQMFNNEYLYNNMMRIIDAIDNAKELLINFLNDQGYIYTEAQWNVFKDDLLEHSNELRFQMLIEQLKQAKYGLE